MKYHGWLRMHDLPLSISYLEELGVTTLIKGLEILASEFLNFGRQQQIAAAILKKITHTSAVFSTTALVCAIPTRFSRQPRWYVILSIAVVQLRLYLQYFLSRFQNRACKPYIIVIKCLFSTSVWSKLYSFVYFSFSFL